MHGQGGGVLTITPAPAASGYVACKMSEQLGVLYVFSQHDTTSYSSRTYDPATMRWWRLRPETNGIAGEYSVDGITWQLIGIVPDPPQATIDLAIQAGAPTVGAMSGSAQFANLNLCPP